MKQLFKEFWFPVLAAAVWTACVSGPTGKIVDLISHFLPAFFFSSWMTGNVNRIRRDQKSSDVLSALAEQQKKQVANIEAVLAELKDIDINGRNIVVLLEKLGISTETILRWLQHIKAEHELPRHTPTPAATPPLLRENVEARADKHSKPSQQSREDRTLESGNNVVALKEYHPRRRDIDMMLAA